MATEVKLKHDAVTQALFDQVVSAKAQIDKANETLLADESGTSVRDIDKVLKNDADDLPKDVKEASAAARKANEEWKRLQDAARNLYRTKVLGEDEKAESDIDVETLKDLRKAAHETIGFLQTYAKGNGKTDVLNWVETFDLPQVGRKGSSRVGASKPRVYVKVGDTVYGSFTEASQGLSSKDNKVTVAELTEAWNAGNGGEEGTFQFGEHTITITAKPKKEAKK